MENNNEVIQKEINDAVDVFKIEELLRSNEKEFKFKGINYKVRKPNFEEKQEAFQKRLEKYMALLKDDKYMLESDLKKLYLKKGKDLDDMQKKIESTIKERDQVMLKLGEMLKNKAPDNELIIFRKQVEEITKEINDLTIEKTNLLGPSIENQCTIHYFVYLTYLITEKEVIIEGKEPTWEKAWKTFDEYNKDDPKLVNKASFYASIIGGTETIE
jgi:hypothetical protein